MKTNILITVLAVLSLSVNTASAQRNRSLHDENRRIHQGVTNGELTRGEAARLQTQKSALRHEAICYKANDGRISRRERADLRRDNKQLSRNIYRQKHDRQQRF